MIFTLNADGVCVASIYSKLHVCLFIFISLSRLYSSYWILKLSNVHNCELRGH